MAYYFDTSALVKLLVDEPETLALQAWLSSGPREAVSCDLARTELFRAMRRVAPQQFAVGEARRCANRRVRRPSNSPWPSKEPVAAVVAAVRDRQPPPSPRLRAGSILISD